MKCTPRDKIQCLIMGGGGDVFKRKALHQPAIGAFVEFTGQSGASTPLDGEGRDPSLHWTSNLVKNRSSAGQIELVHQHACFSRFHVDHQRVIPSEIIQERLHCLRRMGGHPRTSQVPPPALQGFVIEAISDVPTPECPAAFLIGLQQVQLKGFDKPTAKMDAAVFPDQRPFFAKQTGNGDLRPVREDIYFSRFFYRPLRCGMVCQEYQCRDSGPNDG